MSRTTLRISLVAVLAVVVAVSFGRTAGAATPSLYANYSANCTFAFVGDSGAAVTSIAPGTYQVVVATPFAFSNGLAACETIEFHLTGPGVNLATDLGSGDAEVEQHTVTLQPGGTYTVQDDGRAGQTRRTFTVTTSGTPTAPSTNPSTATSPKGGTPSTDPIGSAIVFRGTLAAVVSKTGKLTLTKSAKGVSSLKTGRYTVKIVDGSKQAGFAFKSLRGSATTVSPVKTTGARSVSLRFAPGQWYFFTPGGTRHPFIVTG